MRDAALCNISFLLCVIISEINLHHGRDGFGLFWMFVGLVWAIAGFWTIKNRP